MKPPELEALFEVSAETLRAMSLEDLCALLDSLGLPASGISTHSQALTRLAAVAYAAEV